MTHSNLPFILAGEPLTLSFDPGSFSSSSAQVAARFWGGKNEKSWAIAACVQRIASAFADQARLQHAVAGFNPAELALLRVVKRFGGSIPGHILLREALCRGIVHEEVVSQSHSYFQASKLRSDPLPGLCERLILIRTSSFLSSLFGEKYPDVAIESRIAPFIEAAESLAWNASSPPGFGPGEPVAVASRSSAQVAMDLEQTARALENLRSWKVNRGGVLPVAMLKRFAKLRPPNEGDPFEPPDHVALDYFILNELGALEYDGPTASFSRERVDTLFHKRSEAQAFIWVRAWLTLRLWQDGIGAVYDRDNPFEPERIEPGLLQLAREVLVWALTRVAHGDSDQWLDLETFLLDLYGTAGDYGLSLFWSNYVWLPRFATAIDKEGMTGAERKMAYWMDQEALWVANALMSTMVHLGVVERGRYGRSKSERWCFRLTGLGRAVFGAPEISFERRAADDKCLVVQPNHDILLYLDAADSEAVTTLVRIASREASSGLVQTFKLTRDSIYEALENGLAPGEIESFLRSRSRLDLPANVSQSLVEWSRKREAMVVRGSVAIQFTGGGHELGGRPVGAGFSLVSPSAVGKNAKGTGIPVDLKTARNDWKIDDHGGVVVRGPMSMVCKARLQRFARREKGTVWRISSESVRTARDVGVQADQIIRWLHAYSNKVPTILEVAIRNWTTGSGRVFLGDVVLLQVCDPIAFEALCGSGHIRPFLRGVLGPGILAVEKERSKNVANHLLELGFTLEPDSSIAPLATVKAAVVDGKEAEGSRSAKGKKRR